jgi:hypothetical protein
MNTSETSPTNKAKILEEVWLDESGLFVETQEFADIRTSDKTDLYFAILLTEGRVKDTGFESLEEIRELYNPVDNDYWDSITTAFADEPSMD